MSREQRFYTYALFRENGQPFWIGKGNGSRDISSARTSDSDASYKANIIRDMQKRGFDVIVVRINGGFTEQEAFAQERALIKVIGRYPHGPLANLTDGGEGTCGLVLSTARKSAISAVHRGKTISAAQRAQISATQRGRKRPPEFGAKIAEANRRRKYKPMSAETRVKISIAGMGRKPSAETRKKLALSKMGQIVSAETRVKLSKAAIAQWTREECRNKYRASRRGKPLTPEAAANVAAAARRRRGSKVSAETRNKMSQARVAFWKRKRAA